GAGKSIIVDALDLILGGRADSAMLRAGADRCEISATFKPPADTLLTSLLDEQAIEPDEELLIRRIVNADGRSRGFVNGSPVTAQTLRAIGDFLVDIHGQHANQSLLKRDQQRVLLDNYGGYASALETVAESYERWHEIQRQLQQLGTAGQDRNARLELLRYQVNELAEANPASGEYAELEVEHSRLANAQRLLEVSQAAHNQLSEDDAAISVILNRMEKSLRDLLRFDPALESTLNLLEAANIQLQEAADELRHYLDKLDLDPGQLQTVETRLGLLHDLARKHQVKPEALADHLAGLQQEVELLESSDARHEELQAAQAAALADYQAAAKTLHDQRQQAAATLAAAVSEQLHSLGMAGAVFAIEVQHDTDAAISRTGTDRIEFQVTTNPGQPLRSMAKVASGGELSRISLAIQVIGSRDNGVPTLIFDEVDAGIGGGVAEIVGKLLQELGQHRQIFCVTHLPQVASLGQQHLRVLKMTGDSETRTRVHELSVDERVEEIARMLGGLKITDQTRAHAKEMLAG
ncbi:MAG: DNA repair protein RecN, partial [Gammaproteobacteria bacterium]